MIDIIKDISIRPLNISELWTLYMISLSIFKGYTIQYINEWNILKDIYFKKGSVLNYDLIKKEAELTYKNPSTSKFYLFPAMWILLLSTLIIYFLFHGIGTKFPFLILSGLLLIQNYLNYSFILDIAYKKEQDPSKSFETIIKEREWSIVREKNKKTFSSYEEALNFIKNLGTYNELSKNEILKYGLIKENDNYFYTDNERTFEIYKKEDKYILDEIFLMLSTVYSNLYKEYNIEKKGLIYLLEAFFISTSLYFCLIIN
jgi:hypothetical protein